MAGEVANNLRRLQPSNSHATLHSRHNNANGNTISNETLAVTESNPDLLVQVFLYLLLAEALALT